MSPEGTESNIEKPLRAENISIKRLFIVTNLKLDKVIVISPGNRPIRGRLPS